MRCVDHTSLQGTLSTGWGTSLRAAGWGCAPPSNHRHPHLMWGPDLASAFQNFSYTSLPLETEHVEVQGVKGRLCPVKPSHRAVFLAGSSLYVPMFSIHPNSEVTECH